MKRSFVMKKNISNAGTTFLRLYGSLWITFLVSMIPLYILRGQSFESAAQKDLSEKILMSVIGLLSTFIVLALLSRANDVSAKMAIKEAVSSAGIAVGFHFFLGAILWLIGKNHFLVTVCGSYLCRLIQTGEDHHAGPVGMILGGLISAIVYFFAILLGVHLAHRKQDRFLKS